MESFFFFFVVFFYSILQLCTLILLPSLTKSHLLACFLLLKASVSERVSGWAGKIWRIFLSADRRSLLWIGGLAQSKCVCVLAGMLCVCVWLCVCARALLCVCVLFPLLCAFTHVCVCLCERGIWSWTVWQQRHLLAADVTTGD